jgi:ATP:ADP antiporter, AAA family
LKNFLSRLFRLYPEEVGLVFVLGFVLLSNQVARQITEIVALSGLVSSKGAPNQVLIVWFVDYLIIFFVGALQSLIVDRMERPKLIKRMVLGLAAIFLMMRFLFLFNLPPIITYGTLYILAEQQFLLFPLIFWVLANDIFDMTQARRLFPVIAIWNFVGVIIGTGISAISPTIFAKFNLPNENILFFNVLIYLLSFVVLFFGLRSVRVRPVVIQPEESMSSSLSEGFSFVKEVLSFRFLALCWFFMVICDVIVEFRFINITAAAFTTAESYQRFYSLYRLIMTIIAIGVQTALTSRLIDRITLKNTFFIYPIIMLIGVLGVILFPGVWVSVFALGSLKLTRDTVDETARKSFQALIPEERRGRVSTFMDNYLPAIGTMTACLMMGTVIAIGIWVGGQDAYLIYLALAGVGAFIGVWAIFRMRQVYESSLLNWRIKRRQRGASVLDKLEF